MKRAQRFLFCVALPVMAILLNGCGGAGEKAVAQAPAGDEQVADSFAATGYLLTGDVRLETVAQDNTINREPLILSEGTEIAILERKEDAALGALVRVGIDVEEGSETPADAWVLASGLPDSLLLPYAPADESEEQSEIDQDLGMLKKMTYCYRYVKQYLLKTGQVKVYLPGVSAYMAAKILPKHGFRNTGHSPSNARNGEVCVYAGGPQGHGHIEVKRNGKWWYGYGFNANPIRNRKFLACFAK